MTRRDVARPRSGAPYVRTMLLIATVAAGGCAGARPVSLPSPTLSDSAYLRALRIMVPVAGTRPDRIQNTFDGRRGNAGTRPHQAIDILAPRGTPVLAAVDGEILRVVTNDLGGKTIYATDRARRFVYYYAHLDRYADRARVGADVKQGAVIGYVGTTGNAPENAPHLHFQIMRMIDSRQWWTGPPVNPFGHFARAGDPQ